MYHFNILRNLKPHLLKYGICRLHFRFSHVHPDIRIDPQSVIFYLQRVLHHMTKFMKYLSTKVTCLELDIHGSVHHDTIFIIMTNKMQLRRIIYCPLTALRVSGNIFAHRQEHPNCICSLYFYSRV